MTRLDEAMILESLTRTIILKTRSLKLTKKSRNQPSPKKVINFIRSAFKLEFKHLPNETLTLSQRLKK